MFSIFSAASKTITPYTMSNRAGRQPLANLSISSLNALKRMASDTTVNARIEPKSVPEPPSIDEFHAAHASTEIERLFAQSLRYAKAKIHQSEGTYSKRMKRLYPREYKLKAIQYFQTAIAELESAQGCLDKFPNDLQRKSSVLHPACYASG